MSTLERVALFLEQYSYSVFVLESGSVFFALDRNTEELWFVLDALFSEFGGSIRFEVKPGMQIGTLYVNVTER